MGAKIFYADKKKTRSDKLQGELSGTFRKKDENQSWGSSMKGLFKFMAWIGRYRIYRPYVFFSL